MPSPPSANRHPYVQCIARNYSSYRCDDWRLCPRFLSRWCYDFTVPLAATASIPWTPSRLLAYYFRSTTDFLDKSSCCTPRLEAVVLAHTCDHINRSIPHPPLLKVLRGWRVESEISPSLIEEWFHPRRSSAHSRALESRRFGAIALAPSW
eukprot:scaffold70994_cov30-Tisochrysis_lutea.AAC.2